MPKNTVFHAFDQIWRLGNLLSFLNSYPQNVRYCRHVYSHVLYTDFSRHRRVQKQQRRLLLGVRQRSGKLRVLLQVRLALLRIAFCRNTQNSFFKLNLVNSILV